MAGRKSIGVLALQGAFAKHQQMLEKLGASSLQVRYAHELAKCCALIIPGGESTTMTHQIREMDLLDPLKEFAQKHPLFGTCAGMILMAKTGILSLLDIEVERNAFGAQAHSFSTPVATTLSKEPLTALFIRAPRIRSCAPSVEILAQHNGEPIFVRQGRHLACSFHPELTDDLRVHQYFREQA